MVIISIGALGLMIGAVHAKGALRSIDLRKKATEQLVNYMEYWRGRVADGHLSVTDKAGNTLGKKVYLEGDQSTPNRVIATLYLDPMQVVTSDVQSDFTRYQLTARIKWDDFSLSKKPVTRERSLSMIMTEFKINGF